jgi:OOP family OmpA-OmpF porin
MGPEALEHGMKIITHRLSTPLLLITGVLLFGAANANNLRDTLFQDTDALMQEALAAHADVLSPKNFAKAQQAYTKAEQQAAKGRADKANKELQKVNGALSQALEATKLAKVTFRDTLKFRNLAIEANAERHEPTLWKTAEDQFGVATKWLEAGNVKRAQTASTKALTQYATAELAAIKTGIVGHARELIAAADSNNVGRYAPETLAVSKGLVIKAESDLNKDRYSTAGPGLLAAEAEYEARHAGYIATQAKALNAKQKTPEYLILEWERPLRNVARALEVTTDMSSGYAVAGPAAKDKATSLTASNRELTARVSELEIELGGTEMLVEETERLQRQLAEVEDLFDIDQARVIREGNDLILRLVGLSFPTGQSFIETQNFSLLTQVQTAIQVFPNSAIVIEGHTDAQGADNANIGLSQERADSVREYLIANLGLPATRFDSVGYGKTSPIADNSTAEGRAQNRRIDVVIVDARARVNTLARSPQ